MGKAVCTKLRCRTTAIIRVADTLYSESVGHRRCRDADAAQTQSPLLVSPGDQRAADGYGT